MKTARLRKKAITAATSVMMRKKQCMVSDASDPGEEIVINK